MHVNTILGLTATATEYTANSICDTIRVDPSTTIRGEIIPENLNLSASRDTYRDEALLALLHGERFSKCDSIIIYCTRRDECQRIAALIRTSLQVQLLFAYCQSNCLKLKPFALNFIYRSPRASMLALPRLIYVKRCPTHVKLIMQE